MKEESILDGIEVTVIRSIKEIDHNWHRFYSGSVEDSIKSHEKKYGIKVKKVIRWRNYTIIG